MLNNNFFQNISLISIDLDGTALDKKNEDQTYSMSFKTVKAIDDISSFKNIIISTGRDYKSTKKYFDIFPNLNFLITDNGANVYDRNEGHIQNNDMPLKDIRKICKLVKKNNLAIRFSGEPIIYSNDNFVEKLAKTWNFKILKLELTVESKNSKLIILAKERKELLAFKRKLESKKLSINIYANLENNFLEINNIYANKGSAINLVLKKLNINKDSAMHIGDSSNDLSARKYVKWLVGMDNAGTNFKKECNFIIGNYKKSGLEIFLNKLLKNK